MRVAGSGPGGRWRAGPRVWAVASGKGGVGKSVVTSSLALASARRGLRCALVDADLGGANLHTLLGERSPERTLAHFLSGEVASLSDVMHPTRLANLWLVSGARALVEMANPRYSQKQRLVRHLRNLEVDHVFVDLGAGTAFNVLDLFLGADRGILVVVPEPTSIENGYHFLRSAFYRSLREAAKRPEVRPALERVLRERARWGVRSPGELIEAVLAMDPRAGAALREQARRFAPLLVVNQVRTCEHRELGLEIRRACRDHLGAQLEFLGPLERDECVRDAVRRRRSVLDLFPGCPFARDLDQIAGRLLGEPPPRGARGAAPGPLVSPAWGTRLGEIRLAAHGLDEAEPSLSR